MLKRFIVVPISIIYLMLNCSAQNLADYKVFNRVLSRGAVPGSLHLDEAEGPGIAWINRQEITYGTIQFDIKGKDVLQQSFVGIAFHGLNDTSYEAIYFRPFNFRSSDSIRRSHAVQYISVPLFDWPLLRDKFPNKYEQPLLPSPDPNDWFHVKITLESKRISVYVNDINSPVLVLVPLLPLKGHMIGYWVGNHSCVGLERP
jgi:hypothetical protein